MAEATPEEPVRVVSPSSALRGGRLGTRLAPFAAGAVLSELSLLLPPGVHSTRAAYVSVFLLVVAATAFLLPWERIPRRAAATVPVVYCGSALALSVAAGPDSGIGVVVLIPLVWTALYHTKWESVVVVVSVVGVEIVVSAIQHAVDATILRRVVLWALLGGVITVAIHTLRHRVLVAHRRSELLHAQLKQVELNEDRLRIALQLQDDVVHRIFAATLSLRAMSGSAADPNTRVQVDRAVGELDETVRLLRHTVFDIEATHRLPGRRAEHPD